MENNLSPEESLRVIQTMIDKTKTSVADNSFYFLLWGWLVFAGAILQYVLCFVVRTSANGAAWNVMFIGFIVSIIRRARQPRRTVKTYVDEGLTNIWVCVLVVQILVAFVFFRQNDWEHCYPFFVLTYSIGCFLTGRLLKFAPLIWGAMNCWAIVILMTLTDVGTEMLLMAAAVLVSYIIPGYLLRWNYKLHSKAGGSPAHIKQTH